MKSLWAQERCYQIILIIEPEKYNNVIDKVLDKIGNDVEILSFECEGTRTIPYPIAGHERGTYTTFEVKTVPSYPVNFISRDLEHINGIMRFLIMLKTL